MADQQSDKVEETDREQSRSVSPYKVGFSCKCPNCGDAPIYDGLLELRESCDNCGFDLSKADAGDGAQIFVIMILGALCAIIGAYLYAAIGLPMWAIMIFLIAMIIGGTIWLLRVIKATLVTLQFHHDAHEGQLTDES